MAKTRYALMVRISDDGPMFDWVAGEFRYKWMAKVVRFFWDLEWPEDKLYIAKLRIGK